MGYANACARAHHQTRRPRQAHRQGEEDRAPQAGRELAQVLTHLRRADQMGQDPRLNRMVARAPVLSPRIPVLRKAQKNHTDRIQPSNRPMSLVMVPSLRTNQASQSQQTSLALVPSPQGNRAGPIRLKRLVTDLTLSPQTSPAHRAHPKSREAILGLVPLRQRNQATARTVAEKGNHRS